MVGPKSRLAGYVLALLLTFGGVGLAAAGGAPALPTPIVPFGCGA
jgi:hypothetical protein